MRIIPVDRFFRPDTYCTNCIPPLAFDIFNWLGYAHSTLNPIIYALLERTVGDTMTVVRSYAFEDITIPSRNRGRRWYDCNPLRRCLGLQLVRSASHLFARHSPVPAKRVEDDGDAFYELLRTPESSPPPHPRRLVYGSHYHRVRPKIRLDNVQPRSGNAVRCSSPDSLTGMVFGTGTHRKTGAVDRPLLQGSKVAPDAGWLLPTSEKDRKYS